MMFDFEDMRKDAKEKERLEETRRAAINMLFEMILDDPGIPEDKKISMRIVEEAEKVSEKLQDIARTFGTPDLNDAASEKNYPMRREVLEYIRLVSAGIDTFLESHPAPPVCKGRREKSDMRKSGYVNEWRDIPGYDGVYQISWEGQVRSWRWRGDRCCREPRVLTPYVKKPRGKARRSNRRYVKLTDAQGRSKEAAVMRLMVEVWLGGYPPGKVAYHKNGVPTDFCASNIGFATPRELGRMTGAKSRRIPVAKIDANGEVTKIYPSARKAAAANHMSYQTVLDRCNGKVKRPFALDGYTYRFER